jgi:hypothetical protein
VTRLWADPQARNALALCEARGAFVFQVAPQFCPWGRLTAVEIGLWARYYEDLKAQRKPR